jgi:hypothetical protein
MPERVSLVRPRPRPPRPELVRRPAAAFGWLDAHLLHEGHLARLGPDATAVLVLLALAADCHGASFFGRRRMAEALRMSSPAVNAALARLVDLHLVALRPWQPGNPDGVWQLLPVPRRDRPGEPPHHGAQRDGANAPVHIAAVLAQLGIATDRRNPADPDRR